MDSSLPSSTLADLLNRAKAEDDPCEVFSTGCTPLDRLFGSELDHSSHGLRRGTVVEMSGPPGSGKTNIGLFLALDALRRSHNVLWLSHRNPVPLDRLAEMNDNRKGRLGNFYQLDIDHTTQLMLVLGGERQDVLPQCAMLIIDEMVSCDGVVATRTEIMRRANALARDRKIAILIISSMKVARMDNSNYWISSMEYGKWEQYCERRVVLYRDDPTATTTKTTTTTTADAKGSSPFSSASQTSGIYSIFLDENDAESVLHAARWGSSRSIKLDITTNCIRDYYTEDDDDWEAKSIVSSPFREVGSVRDGADREASHDGGTSDKEPDKDDSLDEAQNDGPSPKRIRKDSIPLARDIRLGEDEKEEEEEEGSGFGRPVVEALVRSEEVSQIPNSQLDIDL